MNCKDCDAEVVAGSKFCHRCGARIDQEERRPDESKPRDGSTAADSLRGTATADNDEEDHKEYWEGGYCGKAMIGCYVLGGLATIGAIVVGFLINNGTAWMVLGGAAVLMWLGIGGWLAYRKLNIKYELDDRRFIHRTGILRRREDRIETIDMDDVAVEQGLLERIVGVGTITIHSSDTSDPELVMHGIENAKEVAKQIDRVRRRERRRRGLHIESI